MKNWFLSPNSHPIRVLLVEDNMWDALLVREALNPAENRVFQTRICQQFEIIHVDSLSAALAHLDSERVEVVLLDLGLPDARNLDALIKIYEAAPEVPVVVLTGMEEEAVAAKAIQLGAQDYMTKDPLQGRLLVHSICHAIERHRLRTELASAQQREMEWQKLENLSLTMGNIARDLSDSLVNLLREVEDLDRATGGLSRVKGSLEEFRAESRLAIQFCKQLLLDSGKQSAIWLSINLSELIETLSASLEEALPKRIVLKTELSEDLPLIKGNLIQLRRLIFSLVLSASESFPKGEGTVQIKTGLSDVDSNRLAGAKIGKDLMEGEYVSLEIEVLNQENSGAPKLLPLLEKAPELSLVSRIVDEHQGALEIMPNQSDGAILRVLFPKAVKFHFSPSSRTFESQRQEAGTVLMVGRPKKSHSRISSILEEIGFKVLRIQTESEALGACRENLNIVLVLLDAEMLPSNERAELIFQLHEIRSNLGVLLMGDSDEAEVPDEDPQTGIAGFIRSPFRFQDVRNTIYAVLKN